MGRMSSVFHCRLKRVSRSSVVRTLFVLNSAGILLLVLFRMINSRLDQATVENHFQPSLDSKLSALLDLTFQAFTTAMDRNNVTYFVYGGSLLGSWRHHGRIPWDDTIDVLIDASDLQRVRQILRWNMTVDPASSKLSDREETLQEIEEPDYTYQWKFYPRSVRKTLGRSYRAPYIDITFYLENKTHIWSGPSYLASTEIWLKSQVFPLRRRPFGMLMVQAPCNPEAFLGVDFDPSMCKSRRYMYNHLHERYMPFPPMEVPCYRLSHLYPFVLRTDLPTHVGSAEFVLESLRMKSSTLQHFMARARC